MNTPDGFRRRQVALIEEGESVVTHMYLDSEGNATVGAGQLLARVEDALALPFVHRDSGAPASPEAIARDFEALWARQRELGLPFHRIAARAYREATALELTQADIEALLGRRVDEFEAGLRRRFPDYDAYPDEARLGLLDMAYNLGLDGLTRKFPTFSGAAREQRWDVCARECRRRGISDERNAATRTLFETAGLA